MGLDKTNVDYYYNLGRLIAIVEIMNDLDVLFINRVIENPKQGMPFQLREACRKMNHVLYKELMSADENVALKKDFESEQIKPEPCGRVFIGYYHEKKYIGDNYKVLGNVSTTVEHHDPEPVSDLNQPNEISELKK